MGVTLVDGNNKTDQWVLRFCVPCNQHLKISFYFFLERLIRTVIITNCVLYSIGAVELMNFHNKIGQRDITVQGNAELVDLRKSRLSMGVTILEHDNIYHYSIADHEPELKMFRNKEEVNEARVFLHQQLVLTF